jgi:hypothetical protein
MRIPSMIKALLVTAALVFVSGCKLAVIVVEGGEVQSLSSGVCAAGAVCVHEVTDATYSESFTAVADSGWEFVKWSSGEYFFCADSTEPVCALSLEGTDGIAAIENIVASSKTFYVMPIFRCLVACAGLPIIDTVIVGDKEWAQPDLFSGLTGEQIVARCPEGVCGLNTVLNGWSMDGWQWANVDEVNALFSAYLAGYTLGPGPDSIQVPWDTYLVEPIFDAGFRPTYEDSGRRWVMGLTSDDTIELDEPVYFYGVINDSYGTFVNTDNIKTNIPSAGGANYLGAWFYRPAAP